MGGFIKPQCAQTVFKKIMFSSNNFRLLHLNLFCSLPLIVPFSWHSLLGYSVWTVGLAKHCKRKVNKIAGDPGSLTDSPNVGWSSRRDGLSRATLVSLCLAESQSTETADVMQQISSAAFRLGVAASCFHRISCSPVSTCLCLGKKKIIKKKIIVQVATSSLLFFWSWIITRGQMQSHKGMDF